MPDLQVTYPLDLSGVNPTNLVKDELHTANEAHFRDYYFLVPNFAPFYVDNFKASITIGNETRELKEDVDFSFALSYVTGTRITGKAMYGGITLHNLNLNGVINLEQYQTVGGDQIADRLAVLTLLADKAYNPRTTIWDILTNVPNSFPPSPHYQDYDTFYGQEEVVKALGDIRDAIIQNSSLTRDQIQAFLALLNLTDLSSFLKKTGDTMTGALTLHSQPIEDMHAATKKYVDDNTLDTVDLSNRLSNFYTNEVMDIKLDNKVDISGSAMTGPLVLSNDPTQDAQATTKRYVDNVKTNIETEIAGLQNSLGNLSMDSVTKAYVDDRIAEVMVYIHSLVANR